MRVRRVIRPLVFAAAFISIVGGLSLLACGNAQFTGDSIDSGPPADASGDDAGDGGFSVALVPSSADVAVNGKSATIAITVNRGTSFHEDIAFTVNAPSTPAGLTINVSSAANSGIDGHVSTFDVSANGVSTATTGPQVFVLTVTGTATKSALAASATFTLTVESTGGGGGGIGDAG